MGQTDPEVKFDSALEEAVEPQEWAVLWATRDFSWNCQAGRHLAKDPMAESHPGSRSAVPEVYACLQATQVVEADQVDWLLDRLFPINRVDRDHLKKDPVLTRVVAIWIALSLEDSLLPRREQQTRGRREAGVYLC